MCRKTPLEFVQTYGEAEVVEKDTLDRSPSSGSDDSGPIGEKIMKMDDGARAVSADSSSGPENLPNSNSMRADSSALTNSTLRNYPPNLERVLNFLFLQRTEFSWADFTSINFFCVMFYRMVCGISKKFARVFCVFEKIGW